MDMDELRALGASIKRRTTNKDLLTFIEGTLALMGPKDCPVCMERRVRKREAQRKWRSKRAVQQKVE